MKIICSRSELNTNLSLVSRAVPSRPTHPVLGNLLLVADAEQDRVYLTAFDLSLGIRTSFPAQVIEPGSVTLPAKLLNDIVSRLPEGEITLSHEEEQSEDTFIVAVTSASGSFNLRSLSPEEFPELPTVKEGSHLILPVEVLTDGLRGAAFAASTDESKQILTGVHVRGSSEGIEFAATDGHRLAVVETEVEFAIADFQVTIPVRALRELEKMLATRQPTDTVKLYFDQTLAIFELGEQRLTSRLLEGTYPAYQKLIPQQFSRQMSLERKRLLNGLELVSVLADSKNNLVKFSLDEERSQLLLCVNSQDVGNAQEALPCTISGESLDVGFNIKYLMDGLKALPSSEISLQLNDADKPVIFTPLGGLKMTYLVMPVQLRD